MFIALTLLGTLPASLFFISKLGLGNPPKEHLITEVSPLRAVRSSREDVELAA
jgi:hypothetical protein